MNDPYDLYEAKKTQKIEVAYKRNRGSSKKNGIGAVNAGGAIVIIIFVVLCLTIFGLLAFATSFADKKLADKTLENMERYYEADSKAEKKLSEIYNELSDKIKNNIIPEIDGVTLYDEGSENGERLIIAEFNTDMGIAESAGVRFYLNSVIYFHYGEETKKISYRISGWRVITESALTYDGQARELWMPDFGGWEE